MIEQLVPDPIANELSLLPYVFLSASSAEGESTDEVVLDALCAIRVYLDMEVAFVGEFSGGQRRFRYVDSSLEHPPIAVGDSGPLEESYCQRVVDGRLPELIQDASLVPAALELPVTMDLPVGAHLSVPIRLGNGQIYGTFCCFSSRPDFTLGDRDLSLVRLFANFASRQISRELAAERQHREMRQRIVSVLESESFTIVYQPIVHLVDNKIIGVEALTRFWSRPIRSPDVWFNEAAEVGLSEELEMAAIAKALTSFAYLPDDVYLSLNVSPDNILNGAIHRTLHEAPLHRIVLEVTEHVSIPDYSQFGQALAPLRERGLRLAVDDAGSGYASFLHILKLNPEIIKLDIGLIRHIDTDLKRRALTVALVGFAQEIGSKLIAEGIETAAERATLEQLRVNKAQGYLLGHPLPISETVALF
ncbi:MULTISPECIES: EAL domain-containing protein [Cyanophyceae]|uniref:sensor domain-containing phosphodiesterase n=1 Tax=Cyanophyceae TaxID=3028117 RepID=UPI001686D08B|nr:MULTISPECIES: EAL domain-containing protein [Cyanophyceae]MBD1914326.1 EAL domain-containing protein [Phormidium sp. FACHB-77]MBD2028454.1 EAL domain-containing protein [Phormidium sp. FACHB-322]MBD2053616.1 EAL domain-containing protein [Leptolyngbya sp. FACHB-60]